MTTDRQNVIDYTYPCYSEYITFTSPMPITTHFDNLLETSETIIMFLPEMILTYYRKELIKTQILTIQLKINIIINYSKIV